jgi:hypothetical protein
MMNHARAGPKLVVKLQNSYLSQSLCVLDVKYLIPLSGYLKSPEDGMGLFSMFASVGFELTVDSYDDVCDQIRPAHLVSLAEAPPKCNQLEYKMWLYIPKRDDTAPQSGSGDLSNPQSETTWSTTPQSPSNRSLWSKRRLSNELPGTVYPRKCPRVMQDGFSRSDIRIDFSKPITPITAAKNHISIPGPGDLTGLSGVLDGQRSHHETIPEDNPALYSRCRDSTAAPERNYVTQNDPVITTGQVTREEFSHSRSDHGLNDYSNRGQHHFTSEFLNMDSSNDPFDQDSIDKFLRMDSSNDPFDQDSLDKFLRMDSSTDPFDQDSLDKFLRMDSPINPFDPSSTINF